MLIACSQEWIPNCDGSIDEELIREYRPANQCILKPEWYQNPLQELYHIVSIIENLP